MTGDRVIFGMANASKIGRLDGLTFSVAPFNRMFQTSTHFAWYNYQSHRLKLSPFNLFSAATPVSLNTFSLDLAIEPDIGAASGANLWLAESGQLAFQLIDSNLEPLRILNKNRNRAVDLVSDGTSLFVALKNINAIFEYNPANGAYYWYSSCEGPEKVLYDATAPNLFIMCPAGNAVQALNATAGTITTNVVEAAGMHPVDMTLDPNDNLIVVSRDSEDLRAFDNSLNLSATVSLPSPPANVFTDSSGSYVSSPNSREIQFLDATFNLGTEIAAGSVGVKQVSRTSTSNKLFGIGTTPTFVYTSAEDYNRSGTAIVNRQSPAKVVTIANAAIISYPEADAIRFYDTPNLLYLSLIHISEPTRLRRN